ncbi:MAG: hypothetical protein WC980_03260 [Candidatus Brocadiia bacterium]
MKQTPILFLIGVLILMMGLGCAGNTSAKTNQDKAIPDSNRRAMMVKEIQQLLPAVKEVVSDPEIEANFVGHWTEQSIIDMGGGLSGDDIYFFPDKTYMYTHWADIIEEHICDKGRWAYEQGFLSIYSDNTIKITSWLPRPGDTTYLPIQYPIDGKDRLLLMGTDKGFSYGVGGKRLHDDSDLFLITFGKIEDITVEGTEGIKANLMKQSRWLMEADKQEEPK